MSPSTEPGQVELSAPAPAPPVAGRDKLQRIAAQIASPHADTGMLAALRRFHPLDQARHSVFETQRVLLQTDPNMQADHPGQAGWALVVHCLALARGAHRAGLDTGAALAEMGFSEARLRQLVEADAPLLADLLPALARRLAATGMAVDWWPLASLVLHADQSERADAARRRIVQGFLRRQAALQKP